MGGRTDYPFNRAWKIGCRNDERTFPLGACNRGQTAALIRPEHLINGIVKRAHSPLHRRIAIEGAETVVMQKRRARPDADQSRNPVKTGAAPRSFEAVITFCERIVNFDLTDRRCLLVVLGGELLPYLSPRRIVLQSARGVSLQQGNRITGVGGKKVVIEKVRLHHFLARPAKEFFVMGPARKGFRTTFDAISWAFT